MVAEQQLHRYSRQGKKGEVLILLQAQLTTTTTTYPYSLRWCYTYIPRVGS